MPQRTIDKEKIKIPFRSIFKNAGLILKLYWEADKKLFILNLILSLLMAAFPIILSYSFKLIVDSITQAQGRVATITLAVIFFMALRYLIMLASDLNNVFLNQYAHRSGRYILENLASLKFAEKISSLDMGHFENPEIYSLMQRTNANLYRIFDFNMYLFFIIQDFAALIGTAVVLISFGWYIPILLIFAIIPKLLTQTRFSKIEWSVFNERTPDSKNLSYIYDLLTDKTSIQEIRIFQAGKELLKRLKALHVKILESTKKPLLDASVSAIGPTIIQYLALIILAYINLGPTISGTITLGTFVFFLGLLDSMARGNINIVQELSTLYDNNLYIGYFFDVLNLPDLIKDREPGIILEKIESPLIEFKNVSFNYLGGPTILKNISFTLKPGEHLAIIGPNGAGKTTLIKLFLRFYEPQRGSILVNGNDLNDLKRDNWYKFVSVLFQDFVKFNMSVKDNIILGNTNIVNDAKMVEAAKKAGAHEFIEALPNKYQQQLGKRFEDSTELSIGQWQKLALARSFYEEAPILILDEPTSAIDPEAEAKIFGNLYELYDNKTLVFISHRFSTVRNADRIIVLNKGEIEETGTHQELMKREGIYARMFKKQAKGYAE